MPAAARITDFHVCPMVTGTVPHVGGPILPPACTTVLIGGLPAARLGDMCTCVGPPDTIVKGSPTVLIGGKPAARMGDTTAHGGAIIVGCPTVLIGDSGSGGGGGAGGGRDLKTLCPAIKNLEDMPPAERLQFEDTLVEMVGESDSTAAAAINAQRHDRDMAMLSGATYATADGSPPLLPSGYSKATPEDYKKLGVTPAPDVMAFKSQNPDGSNHYVLAFRGTETGARLRTAADDIGTDVLQALGFHMGAYDRAIDASKSAAMSGESVELTGHSKGGGQAATGSAVSGLPATTFNAAGVHPDTLERAGVTAEQRGAMDQNIKSYVNERDPLNAAQDHRGGVISGLAAGSTVMGSPVLGGAIAGAGVGGALPKSAGQRITVPAAKNQTSGPGAGHSIDSIVQSMNESIDARLNAACGC